MTLLAECRSAKGKVAGSVPDPGTCLGCRRGPGWEHVQEVRQELRLAFLSHTDISLPFFLCSLLFKNK